MILGSIPAYYEMARWGEKFDKAKEHISRDVGSFLEATMEIHSIAEKLGSKQRVPLKVMTDKLGGIQKIVDRGQMKVVFFGRTSNGKSTVINALLGAKVLPSACGSVSSCFCTIQKRPNEDDTTVHKGMAKIGEILYDNLDVRLSAIGNAGVVYVYMYTRRERERE